MTRRNEKGFSYLEIMISLIIIGVVIGPVGSAMVNATKTQIKAKTVYDATKAAEMLMQEIEIKLDEWITEKIETASLEQESLFGEAKPGEPPLDLVQTFKLDEMKYGMERDNLNKGLAYEVAIWDMSEVVSKRQELPDELRISFSQPATPKEHTVYLNEAIRWQSSLIQASEESQGTLQDITSQDAMNLEYRFNPKGEAMTFEYAEPLVPNQAVFSGAAVLAISQEGNTIQATQKNYSGVKREEKINFKVSGPTDARWEYDEDQPNKMLTYTLSLAEEQVEQIEGEASEELVIYLDTAQVKVENKTVGVIKLVNETQKDVVVKVIGKNEKAVAILPEAKAGRISIQRDTTYGVTGNYVIGIVVRDKAQSGKIVKKMIDIYSYN